MKNVLRILLILSILFPLWDAADGVRAASQGVGISQDIPQPEAQARTLLGQLTPQERVGQLVLVTFQGQSAGDGSLIYDLITKHHVGGVVLLAANNNISGPENTLASTQGLIQALQTVAWQASLQSNFDSYTEQAYTPYYIPLFVALAQEGDGYPYSQILSGMTPLPNQMALGATWDPDLVEQTGAVLGKELAALGVNLLLGPSLDVLENPTPNGEGDLRTRTFGGDPFWVGVMGQAYVRGLHQGSANRLAVVGKYFPGRGSSDRPPDAEIATIRKTLDQLKQIELAPFFAVTGNAPDEQSKVDALLTSHIRYQGLQGNIRDTTRPVSFDPQALAQLMNLPALQFWRAAGGVMVSDNLGSQAVRRFYDPSGLDFNARLVARDALLAGNDMLYLGNFRASNDPDAYTTIIRTLEFFTQKYREDPAFAQRVDSAVFRILTLKYRLYPRFNYQDVFPKAESLSEIGQGAQVVFDVARKANTLISPGADALEATLPSPPKLSDRIIFFTDSYNVQQCTTCPEVPTLDINAMQKAVLRLYGPASGGQAQQRNLISYSFEHLNTMLELGPGRTEVEYQLSSANWVVFLMQDVTLSRPASLALRRLLSERPELLRNKHVIVFALNAPYYLDATDISKLSAYYGLYSKAPEFIDVAARLLFNEIRPSPGALPVSVSGIGYDLIAATAPDPSQIVGLYVDVPPTVSAPGEASLLPAMRAGDLFPVRTSVILDHNGHPVPDGTPVHFRLSYEADEAPPSKDITVTTINGIARTTFPIEVAGTLEVSISTEPAVQVVPLRVDITGEQLTPTSVPPLTPTPLPAAATETPVIITTTPSPPAPTPTPGNSTAGLWRWLLSVLVGGGISWMAYRITLSDGHVRWSMRVGLSAFLGGLCFYLYSLSPLPGAPWLDEHAGILAGSIATLLGNGTGVWSAWWWRNHTQAESAQQRENQAQEQQ
ncbi:MAG: hypothetical protein Fur0018_13400 [Anaerolineales bacterium]